MKISEDSLLFATAFYHMSGKSPNAWTISERSKLKMHYQCMVVCYASLRRLYPEAQLSLFTDRALPDPFDAQLSSLGVDTVLCEGQYVEYPAFNNDFPGCLFTLDVIKHLAKAHSDDFRCLILLDPDCIIRDRLDAMLEKLACNEASIFAYELGYPVNREVNGRSRASLTLELSYFSGRLVTRPICYYGGEFYGFSVDELPRLVKVIDAFWEWMKSESARTFGSSLTEEHVMSVVLAETGISVHKANGLIKRIWTASTFSNVDGTESEIPIWHLPAEKKKGFIKLYQYIVDNKGFADLSESDFKRLVDKAVSLHADGKKFPGKSVLLRLRNAAKVLVTGHV